MEALAKAYLATVGRDVARCVAALQARERLPAGDLRRLQEDNLHALLRSAHAACAYWRDLLDGLGGPASFRTLDDLARLPILDKQTLAEQGPGMLARGRPEGLARRTTGGTTGRPTALYFDPDALAWQAADHFRCSRWLAVEPWDRHVFLWGVPESAGGYNSLKARVRGLLRGRLTLPADGLTPRTLDAYVKLVRVWRPVYLAGFPTAMALLAEHAAAAGGLATAPRLALSWAEPLFEFERQAIRQGLGCDVFDRYGCNEFTTVAHECLCHGCHVLADRLIVELLVHGRAAKDGEIGELVITDLHNTAMPLVRYRVGDLARQGAGTCRCGLGLPTIQRVEGRSADALLGRDGEPMTTREWVDFWHGRGLRPQAIEQLSAERVRVVLAAQSDSAEARDAAREFVNNRLGPRVKVELRTAAHLPVTPMGKVRFSRSACPPDLLGKTK